MISAPPPAKESKKILLVAEGKGEAEKPEKVVEHLFFIE
jgi:hypothetical protein